MTLVKLDNVSRVFAARDGAGKSFRAVDEVSLSIETGDIFGIIGYSGAGKSTLVRLINGLERVSSGRIVIDGQEVSSLPERKLKTVRLGIGMIFQQFNLFPSRTAWGNIEYPLLVAGVPSHERNARVSDLLHFVGLADKAHHYPEQLSGGQKQRVGIARALATSPKILLADEATSALDPETTVEVIELLKRVNRELGITIVVITHEMEVIKELAHKVAVMDSGRVIEQGKVFDIFANPQHESTKSFVSTLVSNTPPSHALEAIRHKHPGKLITVSFRDEGVSQAEVFTQLLDRGVRFELVYGGIQDVQGDTFGHLTFALQGEEPAVSEALRAVSSLVEVREVV